MIFVYILFMLGFTIYAYQKYIGNKVEMKFTFDLPSKKPPAVVGMMVNAYNRVTTKELIATLIDLAYRKKLEITTCGSNRDMLKIRLLNSSKIEYFEKYLLEEVFELKTIGNYIVLEEKLKAIQQDKNKKTAEIFLNKLENWKSRITSYEDGIICDKWHVFSWQPTAYGIALAIVSYPVMWFLSGYTLDAFAVDLIIATLLQASFIWLYTLAFQNLTPKAEKEKQKWLALRRTLDDYTAIKSKRPEAHIIWDRILPYAVALGVSHEIYRISEETMKFEILHDYKKVEKILDPIELGKTFIEIITKK